MGGQVSATVTERLPLRVFSDRTEGTGRNHLRGWMLAVRALDHILRDNLVSEGGLLGPMRHNGPVLYAITGDRAADQYHAE